MNTNSKLNPGTRFRIYIFIAVLTMGAYAYVYQAEPFGQLWGDAILNYAYVIVAAAGAGVFTYIWQSFAPTDHPRATWKYFAWGLWSWTLAEVLWGTYALIYGDDMALLTPADIFWVLGLILLMLAVTFQFQLTSKRPPEKVRRSGLVAILTVIIVSLMVTALLKQFFYNDIAWLELLVYVFYPLSELAIGFAALKFKRAFGRGQWAYPWLALLAFVISDTAYSWLAISGIYDISMKGDFLSLCADLLYLAAYLTLALIGYAQLSLIKYGPRWQKSKRESTVDWS